MGSTHINLWIGFCIFILGMIFLDLFIHDRKQNVMNIKEAVAWSIFWIFLSLGFNVIIYYTHGSQSALEFFTGYLVEKSLSVDNLFVFILIFNYFKTPKHLMHRVLFFGILGAMIMRAIFIFGGIFLVQQFYWLLYILGAFLIYVGLKMIFREENSLHLDENPLINWVKKWMPVTNDYDNSNFITIRNGKRYGTPLLLTLLAVEFSDLIFAIDSIPAIFAITLDPFIVFTSNIFAILGLRALFFTLEKSLELFHYLHYAVGIILTFIGFKMLIGIWVHIPVFATLGFIGFTLAAAIILSILYPKVKNI